jgi:hypothetical protein
MFTRDSEMRETKTQTTDIDTDMGNVISYILNGNENVKLFMYIS